MLKHSLALLAVAVASLVIYNGHASLGSNIQDGTSNTMMSSLVLMTDMGGQFYVRTPS